MRPQRTQIIDMIPREMERNRGRGASQAVDLGGVLQTLEHVPWPARLLEGGEASPRVTIAPRRRLELERAQRLANRVHATAASRGTRQFVVFMVGTAHSYLSPLRDGMVAVVHSKTGDGQKTVVQLCRLLFGLRLVEQRLRRGRRELARLCQVRNFARRDGLH